VRKQASAFSLLGFAYVGSANVCAVGRIFQPVDLLLVLSLSKIAAAQLLSDDPGIGVWGRIDLGASSTQDIFG
jgi:hypothetical protein